MQIIMIAGVVGKDCEVRQTQGGDKVASFSVSVSNGKDANGNWRDSTWYDCSLWGKRADSLSQYIRKGDKITVTGRPSARCHNDKAYLQISVDDLTLQGGKQDNSQQGGYDQSPSGYGGGGRPDLNDEVPFAPCVLI